MSVSLAKGGNVALHTVAPSVTALRIGLGWRANAEPGSPFDLDASALLCSRGRVPGDEYFVFYNNPTSPERSVEHLGDDLQGSTGKRDDEVIDVDLARVPEEIDSIVFCVSIYEAEGREQHFGRVSDAYIRVVGRTDGLEIARYDLTGHAAGQTAVVFGELSRADGEWRFRAVGRGYPTGLRGIVTEHGVDVR